MLAFPICILKLAIISDIVQAIEADIELNLSKVEAGAQGEHKVQRGFLPVTTHSCHYFSNPGFAAAIGNLLTHETAQ
ncbi:hypothetical protein ACJX0J_012022, partial [Zea mays]